MQPRHLRLLLALLAVPGLWACSVEEEAAPPPPSAASLASIGDAPGASRVQLARALDRLFDPAEVGETRALLVLHGGEAVAERYAPGYDGNTRFLGWSMSQCLTGMLIGLLVSDGRLRLNETAPVPAWQRSGDPRGEITLRQLLQMRSGLRHTGTADEPDDGDTARMLFLEGRDNMAAYAEAQPLEAEPGARFKYSSATSVILSDLAGRALSESRNPQIRRSAVSDYMRTRLLEPAGLTSMVVEYDRAGTMIGSSMVHANAKDWARLGEFLRHGGSVKGAQVMPRRWIEFMRTPSPREPAYGAHVWLNRPREDGTQQLFPGAGPESLVACIGYLGQYLITSPRQKLTVVRLGHTLPQQRPALRDRLGDLVALFPVD